MYVAFLLAFDANNGREKAYVFGSSVRPSVRCPVSREAIISVFSRRILMKLVTKFIT